MPGRLCQWNASGKRRPRASPLARSSLATTVPGAGHQDFAMSSALLHSVGLPRVATNKAVRPTPRLAAAPVCARYPTRVVRRIAMAAAASNLSPITEDEKADLIRKTKCFIFDCDGVIWRGDTVIEGVPETLAMLRQMGKKLFFVTNNSTKSRKGYLKKFTSLGLDVKAEEIYSSSYAAAAYLESIDFPKDKKVYVVGDVGIQEELDLLGFQHIGGPADAGKVVELVPGYALPHDSDVKAVVVGFDRHINYYKIQYATLCIRENEGCMFIGTNPDAVTHLTDAQEWAGNGSMVGAIRGSTNREPIIVGKPNGFMLENIAKKLGISKSEICMVGDRLDTDVLFGKENGTQAMLVLTGVTSEEELKSEANKIVPDFYSTKLADLLSAANVAA